MWYAQWLKIFLLLSTDLHGITYFVAVYRQSSNIRDTLIGNSIVDHSDVVGALPVGAAPTTSSFLT